MGGSYGSRRDRRAGGWSWTRRADCLGSSGPCRPSRRSGLPNIPVTADSPRAHITNQRTVEVMRDLGVEDRLRQTAMPQELMGTQIFATSFAGLEFVADFSLGRRHRSGHGLQKSESQPDVQTSRSTSSSRSF